MQLKIKCTFILLVVLVSLILAQEDPHYIKVQGYYESNGVYVQTHYKISSAINSDKEFLNLEKIVFDADRQKRIKSKTITPFYSKNEIDGSIKESVKMCSISYCKEHKLVYKDTYKSSIYCILHTPKCSMLECDEPKICNHIASDFLDFCEEHRFTCKTANCYNISKIDSSEYRNVQTNYCYVHTPRCSAPSCSLHAMVDYVGSGYHSYCMNHKHTCKVTNCYEKSRVDDSVDKGKQTTYCKIHTPRCGNPICYNHAQANYFGSGYQQYCSRHKNTCKKEECYSIVRVDDSGYKAEQTSYCNTHMPKCHTPSCNDHAQISHFGSGYLKYCSIHKE